MFKIGDKVRCVDNGSGMGTVLTEGKTYVVEGVSNCGGASQMLTILSDRWKLEGSYAWRFVLVEQAQPEPQVYLCLCEDGFYIAHEGSLDDLPSDVVTVWKPGVKLERFVYWKEV